MKLIQTIESLHREISACRRCEAFLEPRPVVTLSATARLLIIGQAPGTRVHATGIPWNDPSGDRLRDWLGLSREQFYNPDLVAIMPMGYCYPGKGKTGDLPPRPECRETWHDQALALMPQIQTTLLIGQYAQNAYLPEASPRLTDNVQRWQQWFPELIPLPHPSPRNRRWLRDRPWFEEETVPCIREHVHRLLGLADQEQDSTDPEGSRMFRFSQN